MSYIIDTDMLIYFLNGQDDVVGKMAAIPSKQLNITVINQAELLFGAYNSVHKKRNLEKLEQFLQHFNLLPFCKKASYSSSR